MSAVLDASALLAYLQQEPGAEIVESTLGDAVMSTANWAEVVQKVSPSEGETVRLRHNLMALGLRFLPLSIGQAEIAGRLRERTAHLGLSLGDRACLAVGMERSDAVYTADRAWLQLASELEILAIR